MPEHSTLKAVHLACVALSLGGFLWRGGLMLLDSPLLWNRRVRTLPHLVDTLLLISGLWMVLNLHLNPLATDWLAAKLLALVAYVFLGAIALRRGRTRRVRQLALLGAVVSFAYIVVVALHRTPLPFMP